MKLATTCNKKEQQQNAKNNAEFQTKWMKMIWKNFEEMRPKHVYQGRMHDR